MNRMKRLLTFVLGHMNTLTAVKLLQLQTSHALTYFILRILSMTLTFDLQVRV